MPGSRLFHFARFELDTYRRVLKLDGAPVAIPVPLMSALIHLVRQRGRLVPRRELRRALYRREDLDSDAALDACVAGLRRILGDEGRRPRYVATDPRVGYEFIGRVDGEAPKSSRPHAGESRLRLLGPKPAPPERPVVAPAAAAPRRERRRPVRPREPLPHLPVTGPKRHSAAPAR